MAIDRGPQGPRGTGQLPGTGPLKGTGKLPPPPAAKAPGEAPPARRPGTGALDPDALHARAAFGPVGEPGELQAVPAGRPLDQPAWVGVKRKLAELEAAGVAKSERLERFAERYAERGGDPKVARAVLEQLAHPFKEIDQARSHTCAASAPQLELARRNPARYFRIMTDLHTDGSSFIKRGKALEAGQANYERIMGAELPLKERLNMLFQAAGMEYANLRARYDVTRDESANLAEAYKGVGEEGAEAFGRDLLENKCDLIGHAQIERRIAGLKRDHAASGARCPDEDALRVRAIAQYVSEGRERGFETFFIKLDVPGGRHHLILEDIDAQGATITDASGKQRVSLEELAERFSKDGGRGGYSSSYGSGAVSWGTRASRG